MKDMSLNHSQTIDDVSEIELLGIDKQKNSESMLPAPGTRS